MVESSAANHEDAIDAPPGRVGRYSPVGRGLDGSFRLKKNWFVAWLPNLATQLKCLHLYHFPELPVFAIPEFVIRSFFDNPSLVEHVDVVGVLHR